MSALDYSILVIYIAMVVWVGVKLGGKQRDASDFFAAAGHAPWWLVCASIVATETSVLTVVGIPALAFSSDLGFLQLVLGYIVGRYLVARWFIPRYQSGEILSVYEWIGGRLGKGIARLSSGVFVVTRIAADGVRVYAGAVVIQEAFGIELWPSVLVMVAACLVLTLLGGLRAVLWTDIIQLGIYVLGALVAVVFLFQSLPGDFIQQAQEAGKLTVFHFDLNFTMDYSFLSGLIGGAVFTLASHGADHLIVQRTLSCGSVSAAQRAMVCSGWLVLLQMALFLGLGLLLWGHYGALGVDVPAANAFPRFIVEGLPIGVRGLVIAAIFSAAISTLSSSLSAIASTLIADFTRVRGTSRELLASRAAVVGAAVAFVVATVVFIQSDGQKVDLVGLALGIATITYAPLLGLFGYVLLVKQPSARVAWLAFAVSVVATIWLKWMGPSLGWPWLTPLGASGFLFVAGVVHLAMGRDSQSV